MGKIVYLGFYDEPNGGRLASPAAVTVINYMFKVLNELKQKVFLISPAESKNGEYRDFERRQLSEYIDAVFLKSHKYKKNIIYRFFRRCMQKRILWKELIKNINDSDTLIVYHSTYLQKFVNKIRKRKNIKFVLQFCEIYADVTGKLKDRKKELDFAKTADAYIFASDLLDKQINVHGKPSVVLYGTYDVNNLSVEKFDDGRIHCVYAGTFDPRKGGVVAAAAAGVFLNERYHIHILGFGSEEEKKMLISTLENVKSKSTCEITYDGLLSGKEYIEFLQKCHIGLSTQNPNAAFNATSFPSKVLSYLSNGLKVVTIKMPVLEQSKVNELLSYYTEDSPRALADAIKKVDLNKFEESRCVIQNLHETFKMDFCNSIMG